MVSEGSLCSLHAFFRTLYTIYIHINELHNEYILLNACKKAVCCVFYFALVCMLTTFLFSVSSVTLAIYYHIKNRFVLLGSFPQASFDLNFEKVLHIKKILGFKNCFLIYFRDSDRSLDIFDEKTHPLSVS